MVTTGTLWQEVFALIISHQLFRVSSTDIFQMFIHRIVHTSIYELSITKQKQIESNIQNGIELIERINID